MINFEQRWKKATRWRDIRKKVTRWHDDALIKLERISWILTPISGDCNTHVADEEDPESWHVQVGDPMSNLLFYFIFWFLLFLTQSEHVSWCQIFRSIDSGSVVGFPKLVQEADLKVGMKTPVVFL